MNEFYTNIGIRIWQLRDKMGYSRETFSEITDISPKFLYEIENGKKGMSAHTLYNIAKALNVSCDYLLTGNDIPQNSNDKRFESIKKILSAFDSAKLPIIERILSELSEFTK